MKYTFKILFFVLASSYTSLSALETVEDKFKNTVVQVKITTQHPNFLFPFGIQELEGVAYRTDYDLTVHQKGSGKSLEYFNEETKEKILPHVVEPSAGCDRTVLALICEAYDEETL